MFFNQLVTKSLKRINISKERVTKPFEPPDVSSEQVTRPFEWLTKGLLDAQMESHLKTESC